MTDSQKAAREIVDLVVSKAYILDSVDCTDQDRAEVWELVRRIIDKWLC